MDFQIEFLLMGSNLFRTDLDFSDTLACLTVCNYCFFFGNSNFLKRSVIVAFIFKQKDINLQYYPFILASEYNHSYCRRVWKNQELYSVIF